MSIPCYWIDLKDQKFTLFGRVPFERITKKQGSFKNKQYFYVFDDEYKFFRYNYDFGSQFEEI